MKLHLHLDASPFTVHRLPPLTPASSYLPLIDGQAWYSITKTDEELSLVISHRFNEQDALNADHKVSSDWRCFKVAGPLDFSMVGVMANLSGVLAQNAISLFVVSTYDTDYILVKEDMATKAKEVFEAAGHQVSL